LWRRRVCVDDDGASLALALAPALALALALAVALALALMLAHMLLLCRRRAQFFCIFGKTMSRRAQARKY
jgi:hypothetical protein